MLTEEEEATAAAAAAAAAEETVGITNPSLPCGQGKCEGFDTHTPNSLVL